MALATVEHTIDGSGTILTGDAQELFGGLVPPHGFAVYNCDPVNDLWVSDSHTAEIGGVGSIRVPANGGWYETPFSYYPIGTVTIAGTAGSKFTARRW